MQQNADLLKQIAVELSILEGEVWTAEITDCYLDRLHSEKGEKLYIEIASGRIYTHPGQPEGCTRQINSPDRISASAQRSPEAISHDINRRLIPLAREYCQRCRQQQARHDQKVQEIKASVEQLESYGLKRSYSFDPDAERATMHGEYIKAEIYSNNEIYHFEISHITIDQA